MNTCAPHALSYTPNGAGSVFTFGLKGGFDAGMKLVNNVRIFSHLANIGDTRSPVGSFGPSHPGQFVFLEFPFVNAITPVLWQVQRHLTSKAADARMTAFGTTSA